MSRRYRTGILESPLAQGLSILVVAVLLAVYWLLSVQRSTFSLDQQLSSLSTTENAAVAQSISTWSQWGGSERDFRTDLWLSDQVGVELKWRKSLGKGHAAIVTDQEHAYVCFQKANQEWVEKLRLVDGQVVWKQSFPGNEGSKYPGPHSTPVIHNEMLYCISTRGVVRCLDASDGIVRWKMKIADLGAKMPQSGYGSSPIIWNDTLILPTMGNSMPQETEYFEASSKAEGNVPGAIALDVSDGSIRWKSESFRCSHASPIHVDIDGEDWIVFHGMFELIAVDPSSGSTSWRFLLRDLAADNVAFTPMWDPKRQQILISHGYCDRGTQAITLSKPDAESKWTATRSWSNSSARINHTNAILFDDLLIGTNRNPTTLLVTIDLETGKTVNKRRNFDKGNLVQLRDQFLILEENGKLSVMKSATDKTESTQIMEGICWTVPTIVGRNLLVRDDRDIKSFELR